MMRRRVSHAPDAQDLYQRIIQCRLCPRLVDYRENVKPRASFARERYWRRPVPGFGDLNGRLLVIGLAPATSGGMRTGRIFTGDLSSTFLVAALHSAGFANQSRSDSLDDGLLYTDCYLTAAVKCAPPGDKPTPVEFASCAPYLDEEITLMKKLESVLALGALAFKAYLGYLARRGVGVRGLRFAHGEVYMFPEMPTLYASYHPSPRNTNTGKLTSSMLAGVLANIKRNFVT
jgi:uracil-DNA glycosylase family 4